jgi:hypothetical protein
VWPLLRQRQCSFYKPWAARPQQVQQKDCQTLARLPASFVSVRTQENIAMDEWKSPDGKHVAKWRWGGEMWMSGPEWGFLSIDDSPERKGAAPELIWSDDSNFLAFVELHIDDVPNRKGAEGMTYRICVLRLSDGAHRLCVGNRKLAEIKLSSFSNNVITALINDVPQLISIEKLQWPA